MHTALTAYLLQYKSVVVPRVGTISIHHQPAVLQVAEKTLTPPRYALLLLCGDDAVPLHQSVCLAQWLKVSEAEAGQRLQPIATEMRRQLDGGQLAWPGIGTLAAGQPFMASAPLLPVTAEKVMRAASHPVRVGERRTTSATIISKKESAALPTARPVPWMLIGWILFLLSVLLIAVLLSQRHFNVAAGGSRLPVSYFHLSATTGTAQ